LNKTKFPSNESKASTQQELCRS